MLSAAFCSSGLVSCLYVRLTWLNHVCDAKSGSSRGQRSWNDSWRCVSCEGGRVQGGGLADWIVILSVYRGGKWGGGGLNDVNNTTQKVNSHS